jgi:hypothetical protein
MCVASVADFGIEADLVAGGVVGVELLGQGLRRICIVRNLMIKVALQDPGDLLVVHWRAC